ncbi:hypothetical protein [Xylanibacillus composti]|uniref:Uncharacterized protein n=1 Tax=Xylanibacillus composti TaxID=1572762 RepID=A0A8J4H1M0_9BACL|nr:hypothetical protein [Xylanibacillus composti]GIQ67766.1 hypothetical protein XYCOK13_05900 [Xylanibacillus composti]
MNDHKQRKGHVQIQAPPAKVVAEAKADDNMDEQVRRMKERDGHTEYCGGM